MANKFGAIDCGFCQQPIVLDETSTVVCIFTRQPWYNFLLVACECGGKIRYFVPEEDILIAGKAGCGLIEEQWPDDDLIAAYNELKGITLPKTYELTPRMEAEIEQLATVLSTIPDDLLMSIMEEAPPPPQRPERWTT